MWTPLWWVCSTHLWPHCLVVNISMSPIAPPWIGKLSRWLLILLLLFIISFRPTTTTNVTRPDLPLVKNFGQWNGQCFFFSLILLSMDCWVVLLDPTIDQRGVLESCTLSSNNTVSHVPTIIRPGSHKKKNIFFRRNGCLFFLVFSPETKSMVLRVTIRLLNGMVMFFWREQPLDSMEWQWFSMQW